jgi:hypothetical protein
MTGYSFFSCGCLGRQPIQRQPADNASSGQAVQHEGEENAEGRRGRMKPRFGGQYV